MTPNITQPNLIGPMFCLRVFRLSSIRFLWLLDQLVVQALTRTIPMKIFFEFSAKNVHGVVTKYDEMI